MREEEAGGEPAEREETAASGVPAPADPVTPGGSRRPFLRPFRRPPRRRPPGRPGWRTALTALLVVAVAGPALAALPPGSPDGPSPDVFTASRGSAVSGRAEFTGKPWGTSLTVDISHLPGASPFCLRVASCDGRTEQVAVWGATPAASAEVTGATSVPPADIRSISVLDSSGRVLATATPS